MALAEASQYCGVTKSVARQLLHNEQAGTVPLYECFI